MPRPKKGKLKDPEVITQRPKPKLPNALPVDTHKARRMMGALPRLSQEAGKINLEDSTGQPHTPPS